MEWNKPTLDTLYIPDKCMQAQSLSCVQLCDLMDCGPPASSVHGISQARILEPVAISFSRASSQPRDQICVSCIDRWILYHWATREASCNRQSSSKNIAHVSRHQAFIKEMATHSSTVAWRIPWTEEPDRLWFTGSQRVGHKWATNTFTLLTANTNSNKTVRKV